LILIKLRKIAESISNEEELYKYVLMERIKPDEHDNYLVTQTKPVKKEPCVAELGIIGLTIGYFIKLLIYNK
jgi:hypothetical protein